VTDDREVTLRNAYTWLRLSRPAKRSQDPGFGPNQPVSCLPLPALTSILRGLACSATGTCRVSTPAS
jgi:hypothetical protein